MLKTVLAAGAVLALVAGGVADWGVRGAMAQQKGAPQQQQLPDWRAQPRYATLNLRAGFEPDPREVPVEAGGDREATGIGPDCAGWIDFSKPDVDLNYTSGQYPLYISVVAGTDTTLVVNDSAGNWVCNDDLDGVNPGIVVPNPASGNYNIWVGTFERGSPQRATLRISEVPPQR
jgi:serine protease Do